MWGHYVVTLYRSLTRHRLYAALNVLGLAVGVAVFLVLWLDVRFETGFERWIPDAGQIYVVTTQEIGASADGRPPAFATNGALLDELRAEYPQLVGSRSFSDYATIRQGDQLSPANVVSVDQAFFDVFDLVLLRGDRRLALSTPDALIVSQRVAKRFFGEADPIGRRLTLSHHGQLLVKRITGVIREPAANSDLDFDYVIPLQPALEARDPGWSTWGENRLTTYLRFPTPAAARALDANLDAFTDRHGVRDLGANPPPHETLRLRTLPLLALHLSDPKDAAIVAGLAVVGLLTLLLAVINYINLATARAALRAREVAIRKVMGATEAALVLQFMSEAIVTVALGALIGLALCELALPLVNAAGGLSLSIAYVGVDGVLPVLLLLVCIVGVGAGVYPALVLSRFRPNAVLASARIAGGGRAGTRLREALVVIQFGVAIAFTIATAVILGQTHYLRGADVGFRRQGLIMVKSFESPDVTDTQRASLLAAWRTLPGIVNATAADIGPGDSDSTWTTNTRRPGAGGLGPVIYYVRATQDFFQTYGVAPLAGRLPDLEHGADFAAFTSPFSATPQGLNAVLNVAATRTLGFPSPEAAIGQPLIDNLKPGVDQRLTVIGVVKDIRFRSPRSPVPPTVYLSYSSGFPQTSAGVRYVDADARPVMAQLAAVWRRIAPSVPFQARTSEDSLARYYRPDDRNGRLFTLGAVIAVGLGCLGLYGLASFTTARRIREIGIRKALGASTADILRLLVGQFLRPVLLANLVAWPLAFLAMRAWLSGFDQRIGLSPLYFVSATVLTLAIALATVVGQALLVARAEPAKALRHE